MEPVPPLIQITFVDEETGQVIGVTRLSSTTLPEHLGAGTTVELAGEEWNVLSAAPSHRAEYEASRRLVLRLRRIPFIDPKDVLFTLPTEICDELPPSGGQLVDGSELEMEEDDWRQGEFVSRYHEALVDHELERIREIHRSERRGPGYRNLHVRSTLRSPIVLGHLVLADLTRLAGAELRSVCFAGQTRRVSDSFAADFPCGTSVYGTLGPSRLVTVLAVAPNDLAMGRETCVEVLEGLALEKGLMFVDWCRCVKGIPGDSPFGAIMCGVN